MTYTLRIEQNEPKENGYVGVDYVQINQEQYKLIMDIASEQCEEEEPICIVKALGYADGIKVKCEGCPFKDKCKFKCKDYATKTYDWLKAFRILEDAFFCCKYEEYSTDELIEALEMYSKRYNTKSISAIRDIVWKQTFI